MEQRDQEPVAAEQHALVRLAREQTLVRGRQLDREDERSLGGLQRVAGKRMRSAQEVRLELRPKAVGGGPVLLGQFEAARVSHRDEVGGGEGVADEASRLDRVALQRGVEPGEDLRRAGFRRIRRMRIKRWSESESGMGDGDCKRWRRLAPGARSGGSATLAGRRDRSRPLRTRKRTTGSHCSGASSIGAWPTPANSMTSGFGPRSAISAAVAADRRSDCAPRSTSVGQRMASHSGPQVGGRGRRAERDRDARIVGEAPAAVGALADIGARDVLPLRVGERARTAPKSCGRTARSRRRSRTSDRCRSSCGCARSRRARSPARRR